MTDIASQIEAAMPELESWIGRKEVIKDDIPLTTVQRAAAMLNVEPSRFEKGTALPRQWFSLFFASNAMQADIGPDGHPNKGLFLPPIPLPRRMAAGRRVTMAGSLVVGQAAERIAEVTGIVHKAARSGHMIILTMRHTFSTGGKVVATEEFDAFYREGLPPGAKNPLPARVEPPANAQWSREVHLTTPLVFRYSALTWNAHRIHYDADYTREEEGYQGLVQNGGLTMQLMLDTAASETGRVLTAFEARLMRPLWVGDTVRIEGGVVEGTTLHCWAVDKDGAQTADMRIELA
ncbi:MAG: acyl-CoA dehydrogenase [Hyphomicrobiaceae bacterium]